VAAPKTHNTVIVAAAVKNEYIKASEAGRFGAGDSRNQEKSY
jgi:hypothetical protein